MGFSGLRSFWWCVALLALLPRAVVCQTLQQLCDQQGLALFLRHYATELQSLPDWSTDANVDAADYTQTAAQVLLLPGQQFIDVNGNEYPGDVAFIYQVRPTTLHWFVCADTGCGLPPSLARARDGAC